MVWVPPPTGINAAPGSCSSLARELLNSKDKRGVDEHTLEIRAIEITGSNIADAPMLPEMLNQIPAKVVIGSEPPSRNGQYAQRLQRAVGWVAFEGKFRRIVPKSSK